MSNQYNLDELEEFLSEAAEKHRMFPSDKVWRNINREINSPNQNRWPALTFAAFLTGAIITAGLILIHPDKNLFNVEPYESNKSTIAKNNAAQLESEKPVKAKIILMADFKASKSNLANSGFYAPSNPINELNGDAVATKPNNEIALITEQLEYSAQTNDAVFEYLPVTNPLLTPVIFAIGHSAGTQIPKATSANAAIDFLADESIPVYQSLESASETFAPEITPIVENKDVHLRVFEPESVAQTAFLPIANKSKKLSLQIYATPSGSYRFLTEDKSERPNTNNAIPMALVQNVQVNAKHFVKHSPAVGLEAGVALRYRLTPQISVKAGLQGNFRQYKIEAYQNTPELSTIMLDMGNYQSPITQVSNISNQTGYQKIEMFNRYWQVGVPIGLEFNVAEKNKVQLVVGGSIQPTYLFSSQVYLLSNDYKNYVNQPGLLRRWTMNTSLEAFVNYRSGKLNWQVGPQIRYQLTPTTIQQYPIRDQLIDYGIKIGVVKILD